jgi:energy-coupling factor transporter ATP-binding protein EcfA2
MLNVLIGKNSSGKSNFLEILNRFLAEIDLTGIPQGIDRHSWHQQNDSVPIEVSVRIRMNDEEFREIFPDEIQRLIPAMKPQLRELVITRQIVKPPTGWQTKRVQWSDAFLLEEGEYATAEDLATVIGLEIKKPMAFFFDPSASKDNITGARVVVIDEPKIAFNMGAFSDQLVKEGKIVFRKIEDAPDYKAYLQEQGHPVPTEEFGKQHYQTYVSKINPSISQNIVSNLYPTLKNKFKLVPAARDVPPPNLAVRSAFLNTDTQNNIKNFGSSESPVDQKKWAGIRDVFRRISGHELHPHPSYLSFYDGELRFPIQYSGGGHQTALNLLHALMDPTPVIAFEEPDVHMHPSLTREFFQILKSFADEKQIFVATHSTVMVDQSNISSTFIVKREDQDGVKRTTIEAIKARDELRSLLLELGVRPSDIFFADAIIFVEGRSDKNFLIGCSRTMKLELLERGLSFVPIHGKDSNKYHLQVWIEAAKGSNVQFFMILDKKAGSATKKFVEEGTLKQDDNLFFLKKGDIEDYYALETLTACLEEEYEIRIEEEERKALQKDGRSKTIQDTIEKKGKDAKGWKDVVSRCVADKIRLNDIDEEIKRILQSIDTSMKVRS